MRLTTVDDEQQLALLAADLIAAIVRQSPSLTLLAATGDTPMGTYAELARRYREGLFDPSCLRIVQLDEYLGIGAEDRRSLYGWMRRSLLDPLDIVPDRVVRLVGDGSDAASVCREYERRIDAAGGIGLSVLGLGPNGHLGFNEPPADPSSPTRSVELTAESVASNARYWGTPADVPRRALTAGMRVILGARRTLLLVSGERKREILTRMLAQPNDPWVPASYLCSARDVTVIADRAAWPGEIPEGLR